MWKFFVELPPLSHPLSHSLSTFARMLIRPFRVCAIVSPSEFITPIRERQERKQVRSRLRKSLQARDAVQTRWAHHKTRPLPKLLAIPILGPRPPRGQSRLQWEANRAEWVKYDNSVIEREELHSALRAHQEEKFGRPWTEEGTIHIIQTVLVFMDVLNLTKTAACALVAEKWNRGKDKVFEMVNGWMKERQVRWSPPNPRGAGSPQYPYVHEGLTLSEQILISTYMQDFNNQGGMVTAYELQTYLHDKCNVEMSLRRIRNQLSQWGCTYEMGVEVCPVDEKWHARRIAKFIIGYARALQLEDEGNGMYVIVYMDESYIHNNHAVKKGWFLPGSNRYVKRSKRIGRWVIFHAITRDGLLLSARSAADGDLTQPTVNAEYIYHIDTRGKDKEPAESASNTTDVKDDKESYHGNIDADMFLLWMKHRLIPAFEAKYPGKKMILAMDNASYHNPHEEGWVPVSKMRKEELAATLKKYNITSFTATREKEVGDEGKKVTEEVTFTADSYSKDKRREQTVSHPVPGVDEMKKCLSGHLRRHPELVMTRTRRIMQDRGWEVLFTPPMEARCQPIEQLWGQVKGAVAQQYLVGRTMQSTHQQLHDAFYTHHYREKVAPDQQLGPGVTQRHIQGMIKCSQRWMEAFMKSHSDLLGGDLTHLTYNNEVVRLTELNEEEADVEDSSYNDREARLQSEEDWDAAEWAAVEGIARLEAQWSYMGPEEEREEVDEGPSPFTRTTTAHTVAPTFLVDTATSHLRPVTLPPRTLRFLR